MEYEIFYVLPTMIVGLLIVMSVVIWNEFKELNKKKEEELKPVEEKKEPWYPKTEEEAKATLLSMIPKKEIKQVFLPGGWVLEANFMMTDVVVTKDPTKPEETEKDAQ